MQRTKAWKTQTALLLISILLLTMLPMSAFGAEGDGNAPAGEKPTISVDFLGFAGKNDGFGLGPSDQPVAKDRALTVEDGVFWIGVSLDNLYNATFIREGGIRDLEIGFDYNPKYVTPVSNLEYDPTDPNNSKVDADGWLKLIQDYNLTSTDAVDNADRWSSANYEIDGEASIYSTQLDESYGREFTSPDDWKMMFVTVARTSEITAEENEKNRFTGITDSEEDAGPHYILRAPFRLVDVPDGQDKPLVLRLTLGPSTLVMTAGMDGELGYAWEKETRTEDNYNLKNIFGFNGDINLFQADGANNLNGMSIVHTLTGSTDEIANQLFGDAAMTNEITFRPADKEYYIKVGSTADKAIITMVGPVKEPQVTHRIASDADADTACTVTQDVIQCAWIAEVPLTDTVKDEDEFDDVVKISIAQEGADAIEYIVHIKKQDEDIPPTGEAKITLNYGNSPYGEIMKDDVVWRTLDQYKDDPDGRAKWQEDAKEAFNQRNRYATNYTPESAKEIVSNYPSAYGTKAWVDIKNTNSITPEEQNKIDDPEINLDRNETAIFIYNEKYFIDPGFIAIDSMGQRVEKVDRKITVKRLGTSGVAGMKDAVVTLDPIEILDKDQNYIISEITPQYVVGGKRIVRPDVYEMTYSFYDNGTQTTVSAVRKVVILSDMGDTDLNGRLSATDKNAISSYVATRGNDPNLSGIDQSALRLYVFRMLDTDVNNLLSATDKNAISNAVANRRSSLAGLYVLLNDK